MEPEKYILDQILAFLVRPGQLIGKPVEPLIVCLVNFFKCHFSKRGLPLIIGLITWGVCDKRTIFQPHYEVTGLSHTAKKNEKGASSAETPSNSNIYVLQAYCYISDYFYRVGSI
ncbi:MAG: hypothetical protein JSV24_00605 [Bacteroidales bacterium]|nr:MAG: hypothetical protein JSV24_00605 [Bacteroidales bacterium]